jgi:hypothetical protein
MVVRIEQFRCFYLHLDFSIASSLYVIWTVVWGPNPTFELTKMTEIIKMLFPCSQILIFVCGICPKFTWKSSKFLHFFNNWMGPYLWIVILVLFVVCGSFWEFCMLLWHVILVWWDLVYDVVSCKFRFLEFPTCLILFFNHLMMLEFLWY